LPNHLETGVEIVIANPAKTTLVIKDSDGAAVCAIDNAGNTTCGVHGVFAAASGYTQSQIDNKIDAAVRSGYTFTSPLSKSGTVSIDLAAYQPLLTTSSAISGAS
jgi:hypothetical protein